LLTTAFGNIHARDDVMFDNLMHRQPGERGELLQLLHRMIAEVNQGYEEDRHQNVCRIITYFC